MNRRTKDMKKEYIKPESKIVPVEVSHFLCVSGDTQQGYNDSKWDGDTNDEFL